MTAPVVLDVPTSGAWSLAYVQQVLSPTLKRGDFVILDNLPAHKSAAVREAVVGRRRSAPVPAAVLARLQPDRERLRQAQSSASKSRRPHRRRALERPGQHH